MAATRTDIQRLDRVAVVRQTLSSVAEAQVREAEGKVHEIELQDAAITQSIYDTRAEIAQRGSLSGQHIQRNEKYIDALKNRRKLVLQSLEKAKLHLATKRQEWVEARREQKIIERLQERRLLECQREEDIKQQKSVDDAFIGRMVHTRIHG